MSKKLLFFLFCLLLLSSGIALLAYPINIISIRLDNGTLFFSTVVPEGCVVTSRIIHSLEKTPVEDEYILVSGKLWQWEERYRSNNAGLPTEIPRNGRFLSSPGWFILRGGRNNWDFLQYRVGNGELGRNVLTIEGFGQMKLYEMVPGARLHIEVLPSNFWRILMVLPRPDLR